MIREIKEKLKKLSALERWSLAALVAGLVITLLFNLHYNNLGSQINQLQREVSQAQQRLREVPTDDLPVLEGRLQGMQAAPSEFPKKIDVEAAMVELWNWAEKNNIRLLRINYSVTNINLGEWGLPQHIFAMEGIGELPDIIAYVQTIESSDFRAIRLDDLALSPTQSGQWRFTFSLSIWSQGQKKAKT